MKVCWASNAPWCSTGYGQQTKQVTQRLAKAGHDVVISANYGLQGESLVWQGVRVYPGGWDTWSNDVIPIWAKHHFGADPGWLITLADAWVLNSPLYQRLNVASWVPVDHEPVPPSVLGFFRNYGAVPIAMSMHGAEQLAKNDLAPLYVPHGIDTKNYRPHPKADSRQRVGVPDDAFVVTMVANNKGRTPARKSFPEAFMAFAMFCRQHDDAILYCHSESTGITTGLDLGLLAEACGIPHDRLFFADQAQLRIGDSDERMAQLYSASDVLLAPSRGEGFGIPVIEAQACGLPVIVTDATAQRELCGVGWKVSGQPEWDPDQAAWWTCPSVPELVLALEDAYERRGNTSDRIDARDFAVAYDADTVFAEHWVPVLAALQDREPTRTPIIAEPVA